MVGTTQDVTETASAQAEIARRDAELAQAHELERLKSAFLDDVTHELRGPLTALTGYAEMLEDDCGGLGDGTHDLFTRLHRQIRRLRHLVDDLLDAASLEAGTFRLRPDLAALAPIVEEVAAAYRPWAEAAGIALAVRVAPDVPPLHLDGHRLEQVLTNLVDNAIKFTPAGGAVAVEARRDGRAVRLEVRDTGGGILAEDLPRVFERFTRVGTTFWLTLPVAPAPRS